MASVLVIWTLIFAFIYLFNIIFMLVSKDNWYKSLRKIYQESKLFQVVLGVFAVLLLALLSTEIKITYIFAVMVFSRLIYMISSSKNEYLFIEINKKVYGSKTGLEEWFEVFIWLFLIIATIYENKDLWLYLIG